MPIADLELGLHELADSEEGYQLAELYYEGTNPEHFASLRLRRALRAYEAKYRLRLSKVPVDAVAERLEIAAATVNRLEPGAEDEGEEPLGTEDDDLSQQLQDDIRDASDMDVEEAEIMHRACEYGDAYVIVDHDPIDNKVSLYYNSPFECRVLYDRSGRFKDFAIKVWYDVNEQDAKEFGRATLFYSWGLEEYVTKPGTDGSDINDWMPWPSPDPAPLVDIEGIPILDDDGELIMQEPGVFLFDFGQIPVFHFRTRKPYGVPEHEAAYGVQDMMDKLTIVHMATVDFQGFPQRYFLEDPNFEGGEDEDWAEDDASADTAAEATPKLKAGPGEAWFLQGIKAAGQFTPADADAFLKPLTFLGKAMAAVTGVPIPLFDDDSTSSGDDRRVKESGQTRKVKKRQKQFGATWREIYAYCLSLLNDQDFDELRERVEIRWVPAESIDPAEAWELAGKKKGVGLPLVQILTEQGYSKDDIIELQKLAMEERKQIIELQREQFQASMQERRSDRPNTPNPDQPNPEADS